MQTPLPEMQEIRNRRQMLKISQTKLAKAANITRVLLNELETGARQNTSLQTINNLKSALNAFEMSQAKAG